MKARAAGVVATFAVLLSITACVESESAESAAEHVLVGQVEGSDAYLAVVTDGQRVAGYLCDGHEVSVWLMPSAIENGSAPLVSRQGEDLGEATLSEDTAAGEIEVQGEALGFELSAASGDAGLYRAAVGEPGKPRFVEAGWVVLPDGSVRGAKNGFIDQEGNLVIAPAPGFIDSESDLVVDLGAGRETQVQELDAEFIESGSDI